MINIIIWISSYQLILIIPSNIFYLAVKMLIFYASSPLFLSWEDLYYMKAFDMIYNYFLDEITNNKYFKINI